MVYDGSYQPVGASYQLTYANKADGTVSITGYTGTAAGELLLPSAIDGKKVTEIGENAFSNCDFTGSLTIPDTVTTIGDSAFDRCVGFTGSLTISNSVTIIGEEAFNDCHGFTGSLTLPNSVTNIGDSAFQHCTGFTGSLTISNSVTTIGNNVFEGCRGFIGSLTLPNSVKTIGNKAFEGCRGFTGSLTLPNSVTSIGEFAFRYCSGFTGSLTIQSGVKTIGQSAFEGCGGFTGSLTLPNSVTSIGEFAFLRCSGFTGSLTIPNSVTSIGLAAFDGCSGFTGNLALSSGMQTIAKSSFGNCTGITSVFIPAGITSIDVSTLAMGKQMSTVFGDKDSFAETWATAQKLAFVPIPSGFVGTLLNKTEISLNEGENETLRSIVTPRATAVQTITWSSSDNTIATVDKAGKVTAVKAGVTNITAKDATNAIATCKVTVISKSAADQFKYVNNATGVTITDYTGEAKGELVIPETLDGKKVTAIGNNAFKNCSGFTGKLVIPDSVTEIIGSSDQYDGAFSGCTGFDSLVLSKNLTTIGDCTFRNCTGFKGSLTIPSSVTTIDDNAFEGCSGFTDSLTIQSGVKTIGNNAFDGCGRFTGNLTIPNTVMTIGEYAFRYCRGFKGSLTIPNSVTSIGNGAFNWCSGFTGSLIIPGSVTSISSGAFSGCSGFTGSLTIQSGVKTIGDNAFYGCSGFTGKLVIPDSVTKIIGNPNNGESGAFHYCKGFDGLVLSKNLTDISAGTFSWCVGFKGSLTIPSAVTTIGESAFELCSGFTGGLIIPSSVTTIKDAAFYNCNGFTGNLIIPGNVMSIGNLAFYGCSGFTGNLALSSGMQTIAKSSFGNCTGITSVTIPNSKTMIADTATSGCTNLKTVYGVPNSTASTWAAKMGYTFIALDPEIEVTSVTMNKTALSLTEGAAETLTATIAPADATDKTLTWASDDSAIATVANGKVTAVKAGTANITATSTNGKKATCAVTVKVKAPDIDFSFTQTANLQEGKPNVTAGKTAGTFAAEGGKSPVYTLVKGDGTNDADNDKFTVNGENLIIGAKGLTEKDYHIYVKATEGTKSFAQAFTLSVAAREKLTGTVAISGKAEYGQELTAKVTGAQADAKLHYAWTADKTAVGTDSATYSIGKADVGKTIAVTVADVNYGGSLTDGTATVAKKAITVTAKVENKIYNGGTDAKVSFTFADNLKTDQVTATATAVFADKNVANGKAVTLSNFMLDDTSKAYYTCEAPTAAAADITAKLLTATLTATNKVYDGKTDAKATYALVGIVGKEAVTATGTAVFANKNVGTGIAVDASNIALTGADAKNYTVNQTASTTADITAKPLTDAMFNAIAAQTYTGKAIEPKIMIADSEKVLLTAEDFTVTYHNNIDATKTASANITAKTSGNYSGKVTQTFIINKAESAVSVMPGKPNYVITEDITFTASAQIAARRAVANDTVTFYLGGETGKELGNAKVVNGKATLPVKAGVI